MFTAFRGSKSISTITIANPTITIARASIAQWLEHWSCKAIPGTQVADGTRFVKCVFPSGFVALPWTIGYKQGTTTKYYRVVHNNQTKVCSLCM
jgi:hypothetical protein